MTEIFQVAITSPTILTLTIFYIISEAISIYDTRLIQWKKLGDIPQDTPTPPAWTVIFSFSGWILIVILLFLNWQYALVLVAVIFLLKILPVMEILGGIIMWPFIPKRRKNE